MNFIHPLGNVLYTIYTDMSAFRGPLSCPDVRKDFYFAPYFALIKEDFF